MIMPSFSQRFRPLYSAGQLGPSDEGCALLAAGQCHDSGGRTGRVGSGRGAVAGGGAGPLLLAHGVQVLAEHGEPVLGGLVLLEAGREGVVLELVGQALAERLARAGENDNKDYQ